METTTKRLYRVVKGLVMNMVLPVLTVGAAIFNERYSLNLLPFILWLFLFLHLLMALGVKKAVIDGTIPLDKAREMTIMSLPDWLLWLFGLGTVGLMVANSLYFKAVAVILIEFLAYAYRNLLKDGITEVESRMTKEGKMPSAVPESAAQTTSSKVTFVDNWTPPPVRPNQEWDLRD